MLETSPLHHHIFQCGGFLPETRGQEDIPPQWVVNALLRDQTETGQICQGHGGGRLEYIRNDQFSVEGTVRWNLPKFYRGKRVMNRDWKPIATYFDILILSKGTHYKTEEVFSRQSRETAVFFKKFLLKYCAKERHIFSAPFPLATLNAPTSLFPTPPCSSRNPPGCLKTSLNARIFCSSIYGTCSLSELLRLCVSSKPSYLKSGLVSFMSLR
ncbi:hypothetical protein EON65_51880 [archaeon]|nr:MAG: hypothetical protein EON65_51880 [archaeon]